MPKEKCQSIRDLLGPYVTGDLDPDRKARVRSHLDACPNCATRAERMRSAANALGAVRDMLGDRKLSAERRRRILAAESAWTRRALFRRLASPGVLPWAAAACAAAVAVLAGLLLTPPAEDTLTTAARPGETEEKKPAPAPEAVARERDTNRLKISAPDSNGDRPTGGRKGEFEVVVKDEPRRDELAFSLTDPAKETSAERFPKDEHGYDRVEERERLAGDEDGRRRGIAASALASDGAGPGVDWVEAAGIDDGEMGESPADEEKRRTGRRELKDLDSDVGAVADTAVPLEKPERPAEAIPQVMPDKPNGPAAEPEGGAVAPILAAGEGGGAKLADVVTAPSPFRAQHVLLGLRANRPMDERVPDDDTKPAAMHASRSARAPTRSSAGSSAGAEGTPVGADDSKEAQTLPVQITFNRAVVRTQRQIAARHRRSATNAGPEFEAVFEVALRTDVPKGQASAESALNVATLQAHLPMAEYATQEVDVSPRLQARQDNLQTLQAAQDHPDLYLDACEDELKRLETVQGGEAKEPEEPVLQQIQMVLEAVNQVRPNDNRAQTLLRRVNGLVAVNEAATSTEETQ